MSLRTFLTLISLLVSFCLIAQPKQGNAYLDSLIALAPTIHNDSVGVRVLDAISFAYLEVAPEEAKKWAKEEFDLAKKIGWAKGLAFAYCNFAVYYNNKGSYDTALQVVTKARKIFHDIGDRRKEAEASVPLGNIYLYKKNYPLALKYYFSSLEFAKSINDEEWQQNSLCNIGITYAGWEKSEKALEYLQQSLKLALSRNDSAGMILANGNIGATYTNAKQFPKAIAYELKALSLAELLGANLSAAIDRGNIGSNYFYVAKLNTYKPDSIVSSDRSANLNKGIEFLKIAIADCRKLQYTRGIDFFSNVLDNANALKKTIDKK